MSDKVDGKTEVAETTRATDSVEVGLGGLGEVEVDDNVDSLDVNAPRQQVWGEGRREGAWCKVHVQCH